MHKQICVADCNCHASLDPAACATEVFKIASRWVNICLEVLSTKIHNTNVSLTWPVLRAVPTYLSITTWSSMMLTACTPTPLKQNGRFVPDFLLQVDVRCSDWGAHLDEVCMCLFLLQENCSACSQVPLDLHFSPSSKLQEVLDYLTQSASL